MRFSPHNTNGLSGLPGAIGLTHAGSQSAPVSPVNQILGAADPAQELINRMVASVKPTYFYGGNKTTGAEELVSGTDNLTDANGPAKESANAVLDATVTKFTGATGQRMTAASNSVADIGAEAMAILWVGQLNTRPDNDENDVVSEGSRLLMSKSTMDPSYLGWELYTLINGQIGFRTASASGETDTLLPADAGLHNQQVILAVRPWTATTQGVYTRSGYKEATRVQETLANTGIMTFGSRRLIAAASDLAMGAIWEGAAAETLISEGPAALRLSLAQFLEWER